MALFGSINSEAAERECFFTKQIVNSSNAHQSLITVNVDR